MGDSSAWGGGAIEGHMGRRSNRGSHGEEEQ